MLRDKLKNKQTFILSAQRRGDFSEPFKINDTSLSSRERSVYDLWISRKLSIGDEWERLSTGKWQSKIMSRVLESLNLRF